MAWPVEFVQIAKLVAGRRRRAKDTPRNHEVSALTLHPSRPFLLLTGLASWSILFLGGCAREPAVVYTPSEAVLALPETDQREIGELLARFYGTPTNPVLMVLNADDPAAEDEEVEAQQLPLVSKSDPSQLKLGAQVYRKQCAACHGVTGNGQGPAAPHLDPKPRDYRQGTFKFTSTGRGRPRESDLERIIKFGAKGTSMPSFRWLPEDELAAVVDYVILLSQRGETETKLVALAQDEELQPLYAAEDAAAVYDQWQRAPEQVVMPATPPPPRTEENILKGRHQFLVQGCAKCHGANGQGFTQEPLKDDWGNNIYAANLTSGMLHGGRRPLDVYRRIYSGINGTPMPAFGPEFSPVFADSPENIWYLTYYVLALAEGQKFPPVTDEEATAMAAEETRRRSGQTMPEVQPDESSPVEEQPETPAPDAGEQSPPDDEAAPADAPQPKEAPSEPVMDDQSSAPTP